MPELHVCQKCGCQFETEALFPRGYRVLCHTCDRIERPGLYSNVSVPLPEPVGRQNNSVQNGLIGSGIFCVLIFVTYLVFSAVQQYQLSKTFDRIVEDHSKSQREIMNTHDRFQSNLQRDMERANEDARRSMEQFNKTCRERSDCVTLAG